MFGAADRTDDPSFTMTKTVRVPSYGPFLLCLLAFIGYCVLMFLYGAMRAVKVQILGAGLCILAIAVYVQWRVRIGGAIEAFMGNSPLTAFGASLAASEQEALADLQRLAPIHLRRPLRVRNSKRERLVPPGRITTGLCAHMILRRLAKSHPGWAVYRIATRASFDSNRFTLLIAREATRDGTTLTGVAVEFIYRREELAIQWEATDVSTDLTLALIAVFAPTGFGSNFDKELFLPILGAVDVAVLEIVQA